MKTTLVNEIINDNGESPVLNLENITAYAIQANIGSGSLTGNMSLEASNDGQNWTDIENSSKVIAADSTLFWDAADQGAEYVRVKYSTIAGSANVEIISNTKA